MIPTTGYGSWNNHGDRTTVSVESTIADAVSNADWEWRERMEESGAFAKIADDYRDAINEALPEGVCLSGDEFLGPAYGADTMPDERSIREIIEEIDLQEIIDRHDVDNVMTSQGE